VPASDQTVDQIVLGEEPDLELEEHRVDVERRRPVLQPLILQLDDLDEFEERLGVEQELVYQLPLRKVLL
jgi:hypothetical protein